MIYDDKIAAQLRRTFAGDIKDAKQINAKTWAKRTLFKQLPEKLCRLLSPLL
jgi:cardiolipin synthase